MKVLFALGAVAALLLSSGLALAGADQTPPTTTLQPGGIQGTNGWWRSTVDVRVVCTDNLQCDKSQYSLDGSNFVDYKLPFQVTGDGVHMVLAYSIDKNGNHEAVKTLLVKIDSVAPTGALVQPQPGTLSVNDMVAPLPVALPYTVIVGDKTLTSTGADATSGVGSVAYFIDGKLRDTATSAPYAWTWPAGKEAAGGHRIDIVVSDVAGNTVHSGLDVVTVPMTTEGLQATLPS